MNITDRMDSCFWQFCVFRGWMLSDAHQCSLTKDAYSSVFSDYRYKKDELFKRLKVTTFAQLVCQAVLSKCPFSMQEGKHAGSFWATVTTSMFGPRLYFTGSLLLCWEKNSSFLLQISTGGFFLCQLLCRLFEFIMWLSLKHSSLYVLNKSRDEFWQNSSGLDLMPKIGLGAKFRTMWSSKKDPLEYIQSASSSSWVNPSLSPYMGLMNRFHGRWSGF